MKKPIFFIQCVSCGKIIEAKPEDYDYAIVGCRACGYTNELDDNRVDWWENLPWWEDEYADGDIG